MGKVDMECRIRLPKKVLEALGWKNEDDVVIKVGGSDTILLINVDVKEKKEKGQTKEFSWLR